MSKIGRRLIELSDVRVEVKGQEIIYNGKLASGTHILPSLLKAEVENGHLAISVQKQTSDTNREWGLHRALVANKIYGASKAFEKKVVIVGLGFKAIKSQNGLEFSLGFSHKVPFDLPAGVTVEIDKTGQNITVKSSDKEVLGLVCSRMCKLRPVEPYKGTGIHCAGDYIRRKAGKSNA